MQLSDKTKAVIFDLDGTLVDSMNMWHEIDIAYLGKRQIPMPSDLQRKIEGKSFTETAVYFKETFDLPDSLETIEQEWLALAMEQYQYHIPLKQGVLPFLHYLKSRDIRIGIASSNSIELIRAFLTARKIDTYFDYVGTCANVERSKPEPDVYLHVAECMGIDPATCVVFEDIPAGIIAGKNAGMYTVAVDDSYSRTQEEKKRYLADEYIEDFREMMPQPDFIYVIGDTYVDHSSFGYAIITQVLRAHGYSVTIAPQPDWKDPLSLAGYGVPRLAYLVSAGNMDSMVNHYTVAKKHRSTDAYSPDGKMGFRPDRACIVYSNLIRQIDKTTPIVLGGIEASLRRFAHYDYWSDTLKHSILIDSGADMISYGMGERSIIEIADALASGLPIETLTYVRGTAYCCRTLTHLQDAIELPSYEQLCTQKSEYANSFAIQQRNMDAVTGRPLVESYGNRGYVVVMPPSMPLTEQEMDDVYDLPYSGTIITRPGYKDCHIPAFDEVRFSITCNRGCFGGCHFCALAFHQGRAVQHRSESSILREAAMMTEQKDFKGYIHDVGGPTADFYHPSCKKQLTNGLCAARQCLVPKPCRNLDASHDRYRHLLAKLREIPGVKKVFIRSGIRFDYCLAEQDDRFLRDVIKYHVSGQLRVAPEHVSDRVLSAMGKPEHGVYERFIKKFDTINQQIDKKQYAIPYFMSSHPGSTLADAVLLAEYIHTLPYQPEQVQDFYPTPSTASTCMYYTGLNPFTGAQVYVPKNPHEKAMQRALMQYRNPANRPLVEEALRRAGRMDLIGYGPHCLLRPVKKQKREVSKAVVHRKKTIRNVHKKR